MPVKICVPKVTIQYFGTKIADANLGTKIADAKICIKAGKSAGENFVRRFAERPARVPVENFAPKVTIQDFGTKVVDEDLQKDRQECW